MLQLGALLFQFDNRLSTHRTLIGIQRQRHTHYTNSTHTSDTACIDFYTFPVNISLASLSVANSIDHPLLESAKQYHKGLRGYPQPLKKHKYFD